MQDAFVNSSGFQQIFSWIVSTSGFLSWVGIKLHHPNKKNCITQEEAKTFLEAARTEILKHAKTIDEIITERTNQFQESTKQSDPGGLAVYNSKAYDIEKNLRSRTYFENKSDDISLTRTQVSNSSLCKDSVSSDHLPLLRRYWALLRIQYNILSLQLCCDKNISDLSVSDISIKDSKVADTLFNSAKLLQLAKGIRKDKSGKKHHDSSSVSSSINMDELSPPEKEKDLNSSQQSVELTPRDDGYHSKAGESATEEAASFTDTQSVEIEHVVQETEKSKTTENPQPVTSAAEDQEKSNSDASSTTSLPQEEFDFESSIYRAEWMHINRTVERFSSNTMSLLSWIDELDEVNHNEDFSPKFFYSQASRKTTVSSHIERLFAEVIEDASSLLQNIPSERETLMTVLQNIESQCLKVGIFIGDDIAELSSIKPLKGSVDPKSGFLSSKLRDELSISLPRSDKRQLSIVGPLSTHRSSERFAPLAASTPRCTDKKCDYFQEALVPRRARHNLKYSQHLEPKTSLHDHDHHASGLVEPRRYRYDSFDTGRKWIEFISEFEPVMEWVQMMQSLINRAETTKLPLYDVTQLYERYLIEFEHQQTRKHKLEVKATYLEALYPELEQNIRMRMADLDDLWHSLFLRLTCYVAPFSADDRRRSLSSVTSEMYDSFDRIVPRRYFLYPEESWVDYWHLLKWRDLLPSLDHNIQLSDFSLHQIRDRLHFDDLASRRKRISFVDRTSGYRDAIEAPSSTSAESDMPESSIKYHHDSDWDDLDTIRYDQARETLYHERRYESPFLRPKHRRPLTTSEKYETTCAEFEGIESEIDRNLLIDEERKSSPFLTPKHRRNHNPTSKNERPNHNTTWKSTNEPSWVEFEGMESEINRNVRFNQRNKSPFMRPKQSRVRSPIGERKTNYDSSWVEYEEIESEIDRSIRFNEKRKGFPFMTPKKHQIQNQTTEEEQSSLETESSIDRISPSESNDERLSPSSSKDLSYRPLHHLEVRMSPPELSDSIHAFHHWLEMLEKSAYDKTGIGWEKKHVRVSLQCNQQRLRGLEEANYRIKKIMIASDELLENHGREVSEFCLMWSSWMLEQRYYNLILYSVDMECILERRDDVIEKGSSEKRISHPLDQLWVDCGVDMQPSVETSDKDYDIFWTV